MSSVIAESPLPKPVNGVSHAVPSPEVTVEAFPHATTSDSEGDAVVTVSFQSSLVGSART